VQSFPPQVFLDHGFLIHEIKPKLKQDKDVFCSTDCI